MRLVRLFDHKYSTTTSEALLELEFKFDKDSNFNFSEKDLELQLCQEMVDDNEKKAKAEIQQCLPFQANLSTTHV